MFASRVRLETDTKKVEDVEVLRVTSYQSSDYEKWSFEFHIFSCGFFFKNEYGVEYA